MLTGIILRGCYCRVYWGGGTALPAVLQAVLRGQSWPCQGPLCGARALTAVLPLQPQLEESFFIVFIKSNCKNNIVIFKSSETEAFSLISLNCF